MADNAPTLMIILPVVIGEPLASHKVVADEQPPFWLEVREQTACEAMQDDYCLGRYGFTIKRDGTFFVGPSSYGGKAERIIESSELRGLGYLIGQLDPDTSKWKNVCIQGGLPGIKDQVDVTFSDGVVGRIYDLGSNLGKICHLDTWGHIQELHAYLRKHVSILSGTVPEEMKAIQSAPMAHETRIDGQTEPASGQVVTWVGSG
jgi:hypothetical protein